jgi:protocatechuate 3,4-dioxygenase beta subunit
MDQSRKKFLRNFFIGATSVPLILEACKKQDLLSEETGAGSGSCAVSPTETAGPFPTKTPSSLVRSDIRDDRAGIAVTIKITINDTDCAAVSGAIVDIWHCDKDGYYSEYGGTGMQSVNYSGVHFLRGRQVTDSKGLVTFTSIFPGWYSGRATHIHVHIYTASGNSLLITQIAFPESTDSAVATVNGNEGVAYGYTKGMSGYTYNKSDNVFSDDTSGKEICTVTGSPAGGYTVEHTINVSV